MLSKAQWKTLNFMMPNLKFISEVEILSSRFKVTWDNKTDAGSFSWIDSTIDIGIRSYKKDPLYTFSVLSHEIMEIILVGMGSRFENGRTRENYLFNFDHQTFENAIQIHSQAIVKFLKNEKQLNESSKKRKI